MTEEFSLANKTLINSNEKLRIRNEELSARIEKLKERISQLESRVNSLDGVRHNYEKLSVSRSRFFLAAIRDLNHPLQALSLFHDTLASGIKDEDNLKVVARLGDAVQAASNIVNRIGEIARLDAGSVDVGNCSSRMEDASDDASAAEHSVLLVEADPDVAAALELALSAEGYRVAVAADGWQALELPALGTKWPDLVIAEHNLPNGLSGFDVIMSLQDRLDHEVTAILLTGDLSRSASRAIENRGCACLRRPEKAGDLVNAVRHTLAGRHANVTSPSLEAGDEETPTVFVVDDDPFVLEAMRHLLEGAGCAVEVFATGSAFFAACRPDRKGCILVDALMPDMDGFELLNRLNAENYGLPAIMVTGAGDVQLAVRAMKAGAVDFIEKPVSAHELLACLQNALKPAPSVVTTSSRQNAATARLATLTERQRQIMDLILHGEPNKCIANKLGLSQRTVESHRAAIMKKAGAKSFAALVRWAIAAT